MGTKMIWFGIAGIFFIVGLIVLLIGWGDIRQAQASLNWQSVAGVIVSSDLEVRSDEQGSTLYGANIRYTYSLNGQEYTGNRVFFGEVNTSDRQPIFDLLLKYPKDTAVTVYYDPNDRTQAVLEPGIHGATWFLPALGGGFSGLGLIFILAGWWISSRITAPRLEAG